LLYADEYIPAIQQGQFRIYEKDGEIITLLQAVSMHQKLYINQGINHAITLEEVRIYSAFQRFYLKQFVNAGGKYLYSWVESGNTMSEKNHKKMFGAIPDGLWTIIYTK
jgi:hypothetical protein